LLGDLGLLQARIAASGLLEVWPEAVSRLAQPDVVPQHGDLPRWQHVLEALPVVTARTYDLDRSCPRIGSPRQLDARQRRDLRDALLRLHPWRKGPVELFGVHVDSEWRSDRKWARLAPHIQPLADRRVLDVGCGNGYYLWRMLGRGAALALGIDPMLLFLAQFQSVACRLPPLPVALLPYGIEQLPAGLAFFDTLFCMGVLYHRREPVPFLRHLHGALRPDGELVLETLILEAEGATELHPSGRYAKMRNVWTIPSVPRLLEWLRSAGFASARLVSIERTGTDEQRSTEWMRFESLTDFLAPGDPMRTIEGYPAPCRAIVLARA
jgi:tRNA (mo5U34)-methyltransferase